MRIAVDLSRYLAFAEVFLSQSAQDFIEDPVNTARHAEQFAFLSQSAQDFIEEIPVTYYANR